MMAVRVDGTVLVGRIELSLFSSDLPLALSRSEQTLRSTAMLEMKRTIARSLVMGVGFGA